MSQISAFVAIAAVLVVTPGADTMLVLRSVVAHGRRAGLATVAGIGGGCVVHAILSAAGLSALLVGSSRAFGLLKMAGAAYLVVLGLQSLGAAAETAADDSAGDSRRSMEPAQRPAHAFRDGLMTNLLNPKVALFYLAFLPQFIDAQRGIIGAYALLAGIHIGMGVAWLSTLTVAFDRLRDWLTSPCTTRTVNAFAGAALIGLGVRLATATR